MCAGDVPQGLKVHPNQRHIIYPLGSTIVVKDVVEDSQTFLQGHNNEVSCMAISNDGKLLASGQKTHMGFVADIIIWNLEDSSIVRRLQLHKGLIQDLAFSPCDTLLASLGGPDDNNLVVWEVARGVAVRGELAGGNTVLTCAWFNNTSTHIVTGGKYTLRIWEFTTNEDGVGGRLTFEEVVLGQIKRVFRAIAIDDQDVFCYCGSDSGDVIRISLVSARFSLACRQRFECGIKSLACFRGDMGANNLLVGSGNGDLAMIRDFDIIEDGAVAARGTQAYADAMASPGRSPGRRVKKQQRGMAVHEKTLLLEGAAVTSIALGERYGFVGTARGQYYMIPDYRTSVLNAELQCTAHFRSVTDVVFPRDTSDIFVTSSYNDIRVWNVKTRAELLRIQVPNLTCSCLALAPDGSAIMSGWDDGKVRVFLPQSGKLARVIANAHEEGVSAIACTTSTRDLVSGGGDGRLRIWRAGRMIASLKEHKAPITALCVRPDDAQVVSASEDGSCIVWSLDTHTRVNAFFASMSFRSIVRLRALARSFLHRAAYFGAVLVLRALPHAPLSSAPSKRELTPPSLSLSLSLSLALSLLVPRSPVVLAPSPDVPPR